MNGTVSTHPATNHILNGITREYVLELSRELELPVEERPIQLEELAREVSAVAARFPVVDGGPP